MEFEYKFKSSSLSFLRWLKKVGKDAAPYGLISLAIKTSFNLYRLVRLPNPIRRAFRPSSLILHKISDSLKNFKLVSLESERPMVLPSS